MGSCSQPGVVNGWSSGCPSGTGLSHHLEETREPVSEPSGPLKVVPASSVVMSNRRHLWSEKSGLRCGLGEDGLRSGLRRPSGSGLPRGRAGPRTRLAGSPQPALPRRRRRARRSGRTVPASASSQRTRRRALGRPPDDHAPGHDLHVPRSHDAVVREARPRQPVAQPATRESSRRSDRGTGDEQSAAAHLFTAAGETFASRHGTGIVLVGGNHPDLEAFRSQFVYSLEAWVRDVLARPPS